MSRNTKIVIGAIGALVVILSVLNYWMVLRMSGQTATATASVVAAKREATSGTDNTIVTLSYRAGAQTAQGKARIRGLHLEDYPVGRSIRICYDPADPTSLRIDEGPCA